MTRLKAVVLAAVCLPAACLVVAFVGCGSGGPTLEGGDVNGTLKEENGDPVANHAVRLDEITTQAQSLDATAASQKDMTRSNSDGVYDFYNVQPGVYKVYPDPVADRYWDPPAVQVETTRNFDDVLNFVLRGEALGVTVTVPVQYASGNPMQGITVEMRHENGTVYQAWTCVTGNAEFVGIPPGDVTLSVVNAPGVGYHWDPAQMQFEVGDQDITTNPFVNRPDA